MKERIENWLSPLVVTAGIVILLVLAVFLVNRESAGSVASAAETSIAAENTLGVIAAVRTATVYSLAIAVTSDSSETESLDDIKSANAEIASRAQQLLSDPDIQASSPISGRIDDFMTTTDSAIESLRAGELLQAAELVDEQLIATDALTASLTAIRDRGVEQILVAGEDVGQTAEAVRFLVLFVIPLAVIVAFWRMQSRMTERQVLAKEVEKQRQIAKSKDEFVADVSHELRTPLTGIYGFAIALEENADDPTELESELIGLIINESAELARMVDDLVAIGRIDAGAVTYSLEQIEVAGELEEVMRPFERMGISFEYESAGLTVYADRARFRQILRNLLSNAVKYGGSEIAVGVWKDDDSTVIEIIDDGPGVPEEVASRLFERYVHSNGSALLEGSVGLGLAIAQAFVIGMDGELVYTRADELTVFQLHLPTFDPDESQAGRQMASSTA